MSVETETMVEPPAIVRARADLARLDAELRRLGDERRAIEAFIEKAPQYIGPKE